MHVLQPKHAKLKPEEVKALIEKYKFSVSQLPKIKLTDPCVPDNCQNGDVLKIEREFDGKVRLYYRVVV